jgi:hypothetical protein
MVEPTADLRPHHQDRATLQQAIDALAVLPHSVRIATTGGTLAA